jgi:hypothetical protein
LTDFHFIGGLGNAVFYVRLEVDGIEILAFGSGLLLPLFSISVRKFSAASSFDIGLILSRCCFGIEGIAI